MNFSTLLFETESDGVALVTINRPEKLNALNATVIDELENAFEVIENDSAIKAVVLTGAGQKSFVAGADIGQFLEMDQTSGEAFALRGQSVFSKIEMTPKPVIAAVNGFALGGGCELALACHIRVASETAILGQPEVNLGTMPGYGATQRLPRLVGLGIALEMILTGDQITAGRAYEIGLVNKVVPAPHLVHEARTLAKGIAEKAPISVRLALQAVLSSNGRKSDGMRLEAEAFGKTCATSDFKEGARAFLERRKPVFNGH